MKKAALFILLIATTFATGSCVKKCKLSESSSDNGVIVKDVIIYPNSGYMTSSMGGDYHIDATHPYAGDFQVSDNGGQTKGAINYSAYNILANPVVVKCDASFVRTVTIDDVNQIVNYTIDVTECSTTCDEQRTLENYVLVPAIPAGYTVVYDVNISQK